MYVFNTLTVGKTYSLDDAKKIIPANRYGVPAGFYGGRVNFIGTTTSDVLLLIEYKDGKHVVIDTGAESLENIQFKHIKALAEKRKIDTEKKTKEELILALK